MMIDRMGRGKMSHFSSFSLFSLEYFPASYAFQVIQCTVYIVIDNYSINFIITEL